LCPFKEVSCELDGDMFLLSFYRLMSWVAFDVTRGWAISVIAINY
jgi:hypothetical protein